MNNNDLYHDSKFVRIFYSLVLKCAIPPDSTIDRTEKMEGTLSDKQWVMEYCESLLPQLEDLLESHNLQIAFDEKSVAHPFKEQKSTYLIPFLVSKIHEFKVEDIIIPKPGYTGFKIEDKAFSSIQKTLAQEIHDTLGSKVETHEISFSMATSRSFGFEIYYEGSFRVKREFSDKEIESDGGVRDALELFYSEIESAIEGTGFQVTGTPSSHQRSRNNEYLFDVYYAPIISFSEKDVHGAGCYAIRGDASTDEINEYGIDFEDTLVDETNAILNDILDQNLPSNSQLISCEIYYIDDPEEAFDIDDELIFQQKHYPETIMLKRPEIELQIVRPRDPIPTVEIDIDSIPSGLHGYSELVTRALTSAADNSIELRATIYVYQGMSINFHQQTWSAFFGVAGDENLLDVMLNEFQAAKVGKVRFSDHIEPSSAIKEFHVQDGHVWRPLESGTWYTDSPDEENFEDDSIAEDNDLESTVEATNEEGFRISNPTRFRAARADASIGSIRKRIEKVFGLPEGSVALCGPDGKALRADARIRTLRSRWEQ